MGKSGRLLRGAAIIALILPATLILSPAASHASPLPSANFAAQARAAHLSASQQATLQSEISPIIVRYGGRQVALNEIALPHGASMLFPLPGQRVAHTLPGTPPLPVDTAKVAQAARAARNAIRPTYSTGDTWYSGSGSSCPFYYFCMWQGSQFTGVQFNVSACDVWQELPGSGWDGDGSWANNQSFGTEAYLTNASMNSFYDAAASDPDFGPRALGDWDWGPWWYAMACNV